MSHITSHIYNELISTIEGLKVDLYIANTNRKKEAIRGDALQAELDSIDDFNAFTEDAIAGKLRRKPS